jgi:hypothetical protein
VSEQVINGTLQITPRWSISVLACGWYIWILEKMKKLTYKDLIIALGVLVAAVIIFSSVYFSDDKSNSVKVPGKKVKPAAILNTVVRKFSTRALF